MDPYVVLGVSQDASVDEVRSAWKNRARKIHPDAGGSVADMQQLNGALHQVLADIRQRTENAAINSVRPQSSFVQESASNTKKSDTVKRHWSRSSRDVSSFTIDCLPVEACEALLLTVSWHGVVAIDDPPYLVEAVLSEPFQCWVRFDIVPEAGASTVSVSVATPDGFPAISSEDVRDLFVSSLNELDWSELAT